MNRAASHCAWQLLCALLIACAPAHAAERPAIVASIRPLALIARAIAGDALDIAVLPGVESSPHDFVLRPSALERIAGAKLLLWMGPELERPLAGVLERFDDAQALALLPALDAAGKDPHLWVDPRSAQAIARAIGAGLRARGLLDAAALDASLAAFDAAMSARELAMAAQFAGLERVPFVTLHDGLGPLVRRFGLNQLGALPATHEQQPGARSVAALRALASEGRAVCLFRESADRAELAATIAEGLPLAIVELDPLARAAATDDAQAFDRFLATLARDIAQCLRGGTAGEAPA